MELKEMMTALVSDHNSLRGSHSIPECSAGFNHSEPGGALKYTSSPLDTYECSAVSSAFKICIGLERILRHARSALHLQRSHPQCPNLQKLLGCRTVVEQYEEYVWENAVKTYQPTMPGHPSHKRVLPCRFFSNAESYLRNIFSCKAKAHISLISPHIYATFSPLLVLMQWVNLIYSPRKVNQ